MEATPKMAIRTGNSVGPSERRLHARQRVDSIVYLDIGAGNGGIVLNFSEEGLGFQAVGPLDKQSELRLRIKFPGSQTRIDVTAHIAWLSDSKRQAGVRFLDIQSEGPAQIREWIRSQTSPSATWEESSKLGEEVTEFQRKQETIRELPPAKRHSLRSEYEFSKLSRQKPPEIGSGEMRRRVRTAPQDAAISQRPELVSQPSAELARSPSAGRPAMQEELSQATVIQTPEEVSQPLAEPAGLPSADRPAMQEELSQATVIQTPEEVSQPLAEPAGLPSADRPAMEEELSQATVIQTPEEVSQPLAEPAGLPSADRPAMEEELSQATVIQSPEEVSQPLGEPARSPSVMPPAMQEETSQATPVIQSPEDVSQPLAEPARSPSVMPPAMQEETSQATTTLQTPELVAQQPAESARPSSADRPAMEEETSQATTANQTPEDVSQPLAEPARSPSAGRPTMQEELSQSAALHTPGAHAGLEPDGDAPVAAPSHDESGRESTLGWPSPTSRTAAMAIPQPPDAPSKQVQLFAIGVESKTNSKPAAVNTVPAVPAAIKRMDVWNRVAIAIFFTLCSVLCFGIGTWVGQILTGRHSSKAAGTPVNVVTTAGPRIDGNNGRNAERPASGTTEKVHRAPVSGNSALENRKFAPPMSPPNVLPTRQDAPPAPPEQNVAALVPTKEQESSPPITPALADSAAPASNPRIVAGLTLKPSDRFNPCYLTYRVEPAYPTQAQEQQIEGVVKIQQVVGTDGRVRSVKLLSGPSLLVPAALEAARYWRYLPALLNGQPVETEQDVEIEFRLPN
jgi:protein TonB